MNTLPNIVGKDGMETNLELEKLSKIEEQIKYLEGYLKGLFSKEGIGIDDLEPDSKLMLEHYYTKLLASGIDKTSMRMLDRVNGVRRTIEKM